MWISRRLKEELPDRTRLSSLSIVIAYYSRWLMKNRSIWFSCNFNFFRIKKIVKQPHCHCMTDAECDRGPTEHTFTTIEIDFSFHSRKSYSFWKVWNTKNFSSVSKANEKSSWFSYSIVGWSCLEGIKLTSSHTSTSRLSLANLTRNREQKSSKIDWNFKFCSNVSNTRLLWMEWRWHDRINYNWTSSLSILICWRDVAMEIFTIKNIKKILLRRGRLEVVGVANNWTLN